MPEDFSQAELEKVDICFRGRAAWVAKYHSLEGGYEEANQIEKLRRRVLAALKNG